ncbi:MAG TPA: TetR/AcrR family transcriptional regulator [Phycisphaerales bacterium]|nr:TetR/AcrR family transcriptional regulator [Phycisphaerales bacterium]HRQ74953.1 TetR/AcrR family transcriptional regulator [Phycisphaerales bacterium]
MTPANDTRDRILEAARQLFLAQGYTATGIAQILKHADAKSGSLYYFFPTKEDLLLAVLERYKELLWPLVIQPVFDRVADPIERIFGILDGYRRMLLMTQFTHGCPIGNLALEMSEVSPGARQLIAENFTGWRKAVERCLDEASDRLPEDVDRAALAAFVLTVMEGGMMQARAYRSIEPFESAVLLLRDYIDRLLAHGTQWGGSPDDELPARWREN